MEAITHRVHSILAKKKEGQSELTWEDCEFFINGAMSGDIRDAQLGALLMACDIRGLSEVEIELLMRAMLFSGELLVWPRDWLDKMASLQSFGSSGVKAKMILAPVMAVCGLKFPILSSTGHTTVGSVLSKLSTIPGFQGSDVPLDAIHGLLDDVGCCVVQQPSEVAPAERFLRDVAGVVAVDNNNDLREACMVARVGALKLNAIVMEIPYGSGEHIRSKDKAEQMTNTLVVTTEVARPIGENFGQTLEVAEAVKCLHGEGPADLIQLVCRLGGHILLEAGLVSDTEAGQTLVSRALKDGSARKKFGEMLRAQGVSRADVRALLKPSRDDEHIWSVLPSSQYFTHISTQQEGFLVSVDVAVLNKVMNEMLRSVDSAHKKNAGGIQLLRKVGDFMKKGEQWARLHHNVKLREDQVERLSNAVQIGKQAPQTIENHDNDVVGKIKEPEISAYL